MNDQVLLRKPCSIDLTSSKIIPPSKGAGQRKPHDWNDTKKPYELVLRTPSVLDALALPVKISVVGEPQPCAKHRKQIKATVATTQHAIPIDTPQDNGKVTHFFVDSQQDSEDDVQRIFRSISCQIEEGLSCAKRITFALTNNALLLKKPKQGNKERRWRRDARYQKQIPQSPVQDQSETVTAKGGDAPFTYTIEIIVGDRVIWRLCNIIIKGKRAQWKSVLVSRQYDLTTQKYTMNEKTIEKRGTRSGKPEDQNGDFSDLAEHEDEEREEQQEEMGEKTLKQYNRGKKRSREDASTPLQTDDEQLQKKRRQSVPVTSPIMDSDTILQQLPQQHFHQQYLCQNQKCIQHMDNHQLQLYCLHQKQVLYYQHVLAQKLAQANPPTPTLTPTPLPQPSPPLVTPNILPQSPVSEASSNLEESSDELDFEPIPFEPFPIDFECEYTMQMEELSMDTVQLVDQFFSLNS